jgi:hypothetical protein
LAATAGTLAQVTFAPVARHRSGGFLAATRAVKVKATLL